MTLWITLHILAATFWVGGMMFAHLALRPALAETLDPPQRLPVWLNVLTRFFRNVWLSVILLHASGYYLLFVLMGGMGAAGTHVHVMLGIAWVMTLIFGFIFFGPYPRLKAAVADQDWPAGGAQMAVIRKWVTINLVLGIVVMAVGASGRFW